MQHRGELPPAGPRLDSAAVCQHPPARAHATRRCARWRARCSRAAAAHAGGAQPDGGAGLLLQRHLLHLRAGADRLLRRARPITSAGTSCRSPPATSSARCCSAACSTRIGRRPMLAFTYAMSGRAAGGQRLSVRARLAHGRDADDGLDGDLLLRLGGGERGLSDGRARRSRSRSARSPSPSSTPSARASAASSGPWLFGVLIDTGSRDSVFAGYLLGVGPDDRRGRGGGRWGVAAERKPLEAVATPLSLSE